MTGSKLNPFQQWMVARNIERSRTDGLETVVAHLRAGGYHHVADAVATSIPTREACTCSS